MFDQFVLDEYGFEKNEKGEIKFPDDRRTHRLSKLVKPILHPAKNNLYMLEALCRYHRVNWDEAGHTEAFQILDPMAGAGSIIAGAEYATRMYLIELGQVFSEEIQINLDKLKLDNVILFGETDCNEGMGYLPDNCISSVIFSPPYADQLQRRKGTKIYDDETNTAGQGIDNYTYDHPKNIGNLKNFRFSRAMEHFYREVFRVIRPGGTVTCIIKDRMKQGQYLGLNNQQLTWMGKAGFQYYEWHKRVAIGSVFGTYNIQQGIAQVMFEDIIMMQKPEA